MNKPRLIYTKRFYKTVTDLQPKLLARVESALHDFTANGPSYPGIDFKRLLILQTHHSRWPEATHSIRAGTRWRILLGRLPGENYLVVDVVHHDALERR